MSFAAPLFSPHPPPITATTTTVPHTKPRWLLGTGFHPLLGDSAGGSAPAPLLQSDHCLWTSLLHPLAFQGTLAQQRA